LEPEFTPAYINLSDLYREQGLGAEGIKILSQGITERPDESALHHSLGLALVRQGDTTAALTALQRSVELAPEVARYAYVHGVALNSTGKPEQSISVLEQAHLLHPNDPEILFALATINRDLGRKDIARNWANKLSALNPGNEGVQQLLQSLD
jgi:Flp pilus assembly protein TadD